MKTSTSKISNLKIVMLIPVFALVIASCQKSDMGPGVSGDAASPDAARVIATPDVPEIIKVPPGNKAIWHGYATGVQIYQVTQSIDDPNIYLWTFIEPSATLYTDASYSKEVGTHYVGPTWEATTGRKAGEYVVGLKLQSITEDVTAIPWLLLQAVPNTDPDYYSEISYIQRINTVGGLAPTTGADAEHFGMQESVPYTAEYYFYGAK